MKVSAVVPSYNRLDLLATNLPHLVEALRESGAEWELLVVDDASTDGTAREAAQLLGGAVRVLRLDERAGFAGAADAGLRAAGGELAFLVNNDVRPEKGFLRPLLRLFDDPELFAASPSIMIREEGKTGDEGWSVGRKRAGRFEVIQPGVKDAGVEPPKTTATSFHASGGAALLRRERYLELGGFDPLFKPFFWEDVDLSWRAWRRGWKALYQPESVVHHDHHGTLGRLYDKSLLDRIYERGRLLFTWKNFSEPSFLDAHHGSLGEMLLRCPPRAGDAARAGFFDALPLFERAVLAGREASEGAKLGEDDILRLSAGLTPAELDEELRKIEQKR